LFRITLPSLDAQRGKRRGKEMFSVKNAHFYLSFFFGLREVESPQFVATEYFEAFTISTNKNIVGGATCT